MNNQNNINSQSERLSESRKITLVSSIGTLVEWAEFSFYGYLAFKFAHLFFPENYPYAMLLSLTVFASSYLARPLGAIIFGWIGDRYGRKQSLLLSLMLMGVATLGIGLLPTYNSLGFLAPILLVMLRIVQGCAVSGEFTGAAIFIAEHYQGHKKNLAVSWVSFSSAFGMLVGAAMATIVSLSFWPDWIWRVPFYLGFVGCLVGVYFRLSTTESPEFEEIKRKDQFFCTREDFKKAKKQLIQCFFLAAFVGVYIYICNLWWVSYVIQKHYLSLENAHWISIVGVLIVAILTPFSALFADRIGTKKVLMAGLASSFITVPLIFYFSSLSSIGLAVAAQAIYALSNILVTGTMFRYLVDIFPVNIRYTAMGVSWSVSVAIFGGTAPLLAQFLSVDLNQPIYVIGYICLVALFALVTVMRGE